MPEGERELQSWIDGHRDQETEVIPNKDKPVQLQQGTAPSPLPFFILKLTWDFISSVSNCQDSKIFRKLILHASVNIWYSLTLFQKTESHQIASLWQKWYFKTYVATMKGWFYLRKRWIWSCLRCTKYYQYCHMHMLKIWFWKLLFTSDGKTAFDLLNEVQ